MSFFLHCAVQTGAWIVYSTHSNKSGVVSDMSCFCIVLSALRKERRLSQKQAALELGISQALLSHYENGVREPKLEFVIKTCDYYGVTADYILGRSDDRGDKPPIMIEIINNAVVELQEMKSTGDALIEKLKYLTIDERQD